MRRRVLVADDESHIRDVIEFALQKAEFEVSCVCDGQQAVDQFSTINPDLVILDVGMPELDGLEVCRRIRRLSDTPILFLSARDEEIDRIVGLEIGGDDYVTKPFSPRELVARVNVILKRSRVSSAPEQDTLIQGALKLDVQRRRAEVDGEAVDLTATEFNIIAMLMRRPGVVFNREQILEFAWSGNIHVSDRTIDSHIRNLRSKLKAAGCDRAVRTVHGIGFQLDDCENSEKPGV